MVGSGTTTKILTATAFSNGIQNSNKMKAKYLPLEIEFKSLQHTSPYIV